jgi:hypothetical protein
MGIVLLIPYLYYFNTYQGMAKKQVYWRSTASTTAQKTG